MFKPPHDEPDFLWVDVEELAHAFLPKAQAKQMVAFTHEFGGDVRACTTARNGDKIATIVCHAMAQGLCGFVDHLNGGGAKGEPGPAHDAYSSAAAHFEAEHGSLSSFDEIAHAFRNNGGKFTRVQMNEPLQIHNLCNMASVAADRLEDMFPREGANSILPKDHW